VSLASTQCLISYKQVKASEERSGTIPPWIYSSDKQTADILTEASHVLPKKVRMSSVPGLPRAWVNNRLWLICAICMALLASLISNLSRLTLHTRNAADKMKRENAEISPQVTDDTELNVIRSHSRQYGAEHCQEHRN